MSLLAKVGSAITQSFFRGEVANRSSLTTGGVGGGLANLAETIEKDVDRVGSKAVAMVGATGKTMTTLNNTALSQAASARRMEVNEVKASEERVRQAGYKQDQLKVLQTEIEANKKLALAMVKTSGVALKAQNEVAQAQAGFVSEHAVSTEKTVLAVGKAQSVAGRLAGRGLGRVLAPV